MISMQSNLTSFVEIKILYFIIYLVNDSQVASHKSMIWKKVST